MRVLWALVVLAAGCDEGRTIPDRGRHPPITVRDSGVVTSSAADAAMIADVGEPKADVGPRDGGRAFFDARVPQDDAQASDFDAQIAQVSDAGAGRPDAFFPGFPDAALPPGTSEIWIEIDYSSAQSPRSPAFRYSNTPGWGAAQWAAVNANWPEAWDRFNDMQVVNDPIGTSLEIGGGSELQLMIGLEELIAYDHAEVTIEGRSRATSSSAQFDAYNPWNGCGNSSSFGQQWQVQSTTLDLAQCYEIGQGVQAMRVAPTSGTIALVRLRLTLYGAVY